MKTSKQIEDDININIKEINKMLSETDEKQIKKCKKKIKNLLEENTVFKQLIWYLETNPSQVVLEQQRYDLENLIEAKKSQYNSWLKNTPGLKGIKDVQKEYDKITDRKKNEEQLKTLNYLLG